MKTRHLSILIILVMIILGITKEAYSYGSDGGYLVPSPPLPVSFTITTNLEKYTTNETIMISAYVPNPDSNTSLVIKILGPDYNLRDLHTFSPDPNKVGYTWAVISNGPLFYNSGNYTITAQYGQNHAVTNFYLHSTQSLITLAHPSSPLKQFRSGILPEDIQCPSNLALVFKAKDDTPACVKYTTANTLIERGWAKKTVLDKTDSETTVEIPVNSSIVSNGFTFTPPVVNTVIGTNNTVRWINLDSVANDVTSDTNFFKSGLIESGYAWIHTFDKPGTYGYHSVIHPWLKGTVIVTSNPLINLKNDTGMITLGSQTYYFETPHYNETAYVHPLQISFHDVVFTLFPSGFRGGLPTSCGDTYYWTDTKFSDGTSELLYIFAGPKCPVPPLPTYFSNHANPQAGLTFYDGKMKLLVSTKNQTSVQLTNHEIPSIFPGEYVLSSCGGGAVQYHTSSNILNSTGFSVYRNVLNYSYFNNDDYVIAPGHQGTITYVIDAGSSPISHIPYPVQKELNVTNYAIFYHRITDYEELLHNPSVTISGGDYKSCFKRPDGSCAGMSGPITGPIDATVVDHPGVSVSFEPASELLQYNDTAKGKSSQIITMTVSVDTNSPQGTYLVILSPEECRGGEIFLLTVGDKPYHS